MNSTVSAKLAEHQGVNRDKTVGEDKVVHLNACATPLALKSALTHRSRTLRAKKPTLPQEKWMSQILPHPPVYSSKTIKICDSLYPKLKNNGWHVLKSRYFTLHEFCSSEFLIFFTFFPLIPCLITTLFWEVAIASQNWFQALFSLSVCLSENSKSCCCCCFNTWVRVTVTWAVAPESRWR